MSLRALRTLTVISRKGSFSAAAEQLGLTQAAVSLQMKGLEEELDAELFDRSGRSPRLNAAGRLALARAEEILALYDGLRDEISPEGAVRGVLVLGVIPTALTGPVPRVLARLKDEHAELQVRIRSGISDGLAPLVEEGEVDAALISEPPYAVPASCEWRPYDEEPFYVVGPKTAAPRDDVALFDELPFVCFDKTAWTGALIEGHLMARGIRPREVMELDSLEAVLSLVEEGLGVAVAPFNRARLALARKRFSVMPLGEPQLRRRVGLYERRRHPRRLLTELLFQGLREECKR
ncbi:MAG: LysR family transcriptional regulator [Deferrisomatales bacterium]